MERNRLQKTTESILGLTKELEEALWNLSMIHYEMSLKKDHILRFTEQENKQFIDLLNTKIKKISIPLYEMKKQFKPLVATLNAVPRFNVKKELPIPTPNSFTKYAQRLSPNTMLELKRMYSK